MNKNKHNQPQFTIKNVAILMLVATALGSTLMWLMIQYDLSEWYHQVNHFTSSFDSFVRAVNEYPIDLVAVLTIFIGGGWVYGRIQTGIFRLFNISIYRWTIATVLGCFLGLIHLILAYLYWMPIYETLDRLIWWSELRLIFNFFYLHLFFAVALPVGIAQWWLLRKQFYYSWLWVLTHGFGSLAVGVIIYYERYPDLDDPKLYITAIGFSLAIATSFLWIIRHPRRGLLKADFESPSVS